MALQDVYPWSVTFLFEDNNGKFGSTQVFFPNGIAYEVVLQSATELANDLQAISDASLVNFNISRSIVQDAPAVPAPSSEVERKLRVSLGTALIKNASSIEVPSPKFDIEIAGTDVVDPADPLVVALLAELALGSGGPGNGITDNRGADITRVGTPVIVHRTRKPRT